MPEGDTLPRAAAQLAPILIGRSVVALELPRRAERTEAIVNRSITGVEARGKNLLVHFEGDFSLHVHLKMLGRIFIRARAEARAPSPDTVVVLDTEKHRVQVVHAPVARLIRTRDLVRDLHFRGLGPDVLAPGFRPDEALARLRVGIRRLNEHHGTPNSATSGYHETVTRAYVQLLAELLASCPAEMSVRERIAVVVTGPLADRNVLLRFYSRERLMSPEARAAWVEPDLRELPEPG